MLISNKSSAGTAEEIPMVPQKNFHTKDLTLRTSSIIRRSESEKKANINRQRFPLTLRDGGLLRTAGD
jgi:hypothetical protein